MIHTFAPNQQDTTKLFSGTTRLIHFPWNDVSQQPTLAANRHHYAALVSDSTTKLQQCIQSLLTLLNDRAIVLTRCANFDAALRDATAMQEISPSSPLGYLRAATIYSEQGRQRAVVDVCNKGLNAVHINDPGYSKLEEAKMVAMQRDACLLDFVGQLPLDIVMDVLFPMLLGDDGILDSKKGCPYLEVSKTWLDRAIETAGGGLHFIIPDQYSLAQVVRFAQHTKTIHIEFYSQGTWLPHLLYRANLCSLVEIKIKGLEDSINVGHLVSSLRSVSNTLTRLTIWKSNNGPLWPRGCSAQQPKRKRPLPVAEILINCPNLMMLDLAYQFTADFSAVPLTKTWPHLTTLYLNHYEGATFDGQFLEILKRFPSLKRLVLNPCIEPQPMTMIHRYCPSMRELQLKIKRIQSSSARHEQQHDDQCMRGRGGLKKIWISEGSQNDDAWMDMRKVLQQHHNTLVHLELNLDDAGNNDDGVFSLEFPCLKTLALRRHYSNNVCFGWWIMRKAPFLEELSITANVIKLSPGLLGFTPPPTLRKLVLDLRHVIRVDETTVVGRFLERFSQQKKATSLKELQLRFHSSGDVTPDTLVASICHLNQLQHLSISYTLLWEQWEMDHFTQMLVEGCPHLISLELNGRRPLSCYAMNILKRLQHFRRLAFNIV